MATHTGLEGHVNVGANTIAEVRSWSIEESSDTTDSTTMGVTNNWRTHKATLKSWSGNIDCFWDETDTNGQVALVIGTEVSLNVYPESDDSGDSYFNGSAIVTGITRQAAIDGLVETSFSFQGTGELLKPTVA
jgi:predicted secreted protein